MFKPKAFNFILLKYYNIIVYYYHMPIASETESINMAYRLYVQAVDKVIDV